MAYNTFVQYILSNSTVTASGASTLFQRYSSQEISLIVNVKAAPTGTSPSLTFTISEVDPGDQTTVMGVTKSGVAITEVTTQIITIPVTSTGCLLVTWTVTGTTPSFTQVYATLVDKVTGPVIYDAAGNGPVAVKPASTAVAAADASFAVGLSPNSPLPVGSNAIGSVTATQATAGNLNATVVQGAGSGAAATFWYVRVTDGTNTLPTMDAVARAGFQKITDGTNGPVGVKAASTAPVAADPALVVSISPNSTGSKSSTATLSNVAGSVSSVTLLAANTLRLGATIVNDSTAFLYVKFGSTASTTSYTYRLFPYATLELPQPIYDGIVTGIWSVATGNARVTEMTL